MANTQLSLFGKTYPEPLAVAEDKILGQSLKKSQRPKFQCLQVVNGQLQEWLEGTDVVLRGECLTRNIGEYPNGERESSLSQILQDNVPEKYFLSARATIGILRRAAKRGKELPPVLRMALEEQSGLRRDTIGQKEITDTGALLRKLWETVDKTTFEQWLRGSLVLVQQKKILRFDLLCGVEKETAEKAEVCEVGQGCSEVTDTEGELRELWETGCNGHPPQGWEPVKQFARELNKALQEVSYQRTPAEVFLLCMWQASESEKSLRQSLQGVYAEVGEGAASSDNVITSWSPKMWKEGSGATNPLLATDYKDPQVVIRRGVSGDFKKSREERQETTNGVGTGTKNTVKCLTSWDCQSKRIFDPDGSYPTLQAMDGGGANNTAVLIAGTVSAKWAKGTGGPAGDECQNLVVHPKVTGTLCSSGADMSRPAGMANETDLAIVQKIPTYSAITGQQTYTSSSFAQYVEGVGTLKASGGDLGGGSETLVCSYAVRRLTPTECERLQGFPDGWTNIPGASDTGRYKALGNSVAVPCVSWIIGRVREALVRANLPELIEGEIEEREEQSVWVSRLTS